MGFINVAERTINAKLVYFGVGVGGKTTSLQQVHGILCPRNEVQLVSINTEEESTLLFDFLPINLGNVGGFKIKIQGFTVPGQPKYKQMRKYVLAGADAVVFVVDSQRSRLQENLDSLQNMRENLRASSSESIPIVVQYNKRDLDDILSEGELDNHFRFRKDIESFPTVATEGQGVFEAFVHAAGVLVERKISQYGLSRGDATAAEIAEGARRKLWEICDQVRRDRSVVQKKDLPTAKVSLAEALPEVPGLQLRDSAPERNRGPQQSEEDIGLSYELRDELPTREVISDAELDVDLNLPEVAQQARNQPVPASPPEEVDESLLDKSVQSNLELAARFGQLDEYRTLLERKVNELVEVAQNTVHDLNKPVSALKLMLSSVAKGYLGDVSEKVGQAVQNGLCAVQQMERLIRDLLDSSRLDHDGVKLKFEPVDMTLLVAGVINSLRYEVEEKNVHIRLEPLPVMQVDEWALTKVFMNLLGNAIQYTSPDRHPVVTVACTQVDREWQVVIRDNGIGIPNKDRDRLFRRFERGSNTAGISGTGLGLHIIKEIVQGHGGRVQLDSVEGEGTTFTLHLPLTPTLAAHSPVSETAARADL